MRGDDSPTAVDEAAQDAGQQAAGQQVAGSGVLRRIWRRRPVRYTSCLAAGVVVVLGIALGATTALRGPGIPADARIPSPPSTNAAFIENRLGIAQDNYNNIARTTAPGVVRIESAGTTVGSGMIITRSGLVLATDHGLGSAGKDSAGALKAVGALTGHVYGARVIGTDPVADLALLQLSGAGSYKTVRVGNAYDAHAGDQVSSVGAGPGHTVLVSTGNIIATNTRYTLGGHTITGLLETNALDLPQQEDGGPVVTLTGQVLGMSVAAAPSLGKGAGFALPINGVLAVAKQIAGQS